MADLITPVVIATFGGAMALVVMGFLLVRQRSGKPRFESQDYYKTYRRPDRNTQPQYRPGQTPQDQKQQRAILIAVIVLIGASIALAIYEPLYGLLLLFLLPIIVRFMRARSETRRAPHDENQSY
jgi:hypothetical protein